MRNQQAALLLLEQQTLLVSIKEHQHKVLGHNDCAKANADIKAQTMAAVK